jgi:hypothetical protein
LDDRVNPHWLLNGIVWEEMSHSATSSPERATQTSERTSFLSGRFKSDPQSASPASPTIVDTAAGDAPSDS